MCTGGHVGQVRVDERVDPVDGYANQLRPDLLVVADHDGAVGQAERGQGEDVGLGCLVNDDDIEEWFTRAELFHGPVDRHDPHWYGGDRLRHGLLRDRLPMRGTLTGSLTDLAQRGGPVGERGLLTVVEGARHFQPCTGDDDICGQPADPVAVLLDAAAESDCVNGADHRVEPGLCLPPPPPGSDGMRSVAWDG